MIISQTPLRISFFGGGTDFAGYYREGAGCVLSTAIDKYIFVVLKRRFDAMIRVGYTRTELVERVEQVEHDLVREALLAAGVTSQIEITTLGDIPSEGSGLGSSSTVTVGLLNALHAHLNRPVAHEQLARQACEIEIERLGKPIGKQDQYIAAYGGLHLITFNPDESVTIEDVALEAEPRRRLNHNLLLFYTQTTRKSESVLTEQRRSIPAKRAALDELKAMALEGKALLESGNFDAFGCLLDESWQLKKGLASQISNSAIDEIYARARQAGALGGKIAGAGGGGFMLLYCPLERQPALRAALQPLVELPFRFEGEGSKVIFNQRRVE